MLKVVIEGDPKEIAVLALALQGRLGGDITVETDGAQITKSVLKAIRGMPQAPEEQG